MGFSMGEFYARAAIREALGGGEPRTYLPQHDRRIIAGCFGRKRNPDAPEEIQVGKGPQNIKKAELLAQQPEQRIPVFVKKAATKDTNRA